PGEQDESPPRRHGGYAQKDAWEAPIRMPVPLVADSTWRRPFSALQMLRRPWMYSDKPSATSLPHRMNRSSNPPALLKTSRRTARHAPVTASTSRVQRVEPVSVVDPGCRPWKRCAAKPVTPTTTPPC